MEKEDREKEQLETGKVKFFRWEDGYGFIVCENGDELFFHLSNGRSFEPGEHEPVFAYKEPVVRNPQVDDDVVFFRRTTANSRPKASPWGFADEYNYVKQDMAFRPEYRVLEQVNTPDEEPAEPTILWQGFYLQNLRNLYPRPKKKTGHRATDPLESQFERPDGMTVWFERRDPGGEWKKCKDPRPR